jgi:hypothetical protein
MVVYNYNPSTQEAEAGGWQVPGYPVLQERPSQKQTNKNISYFIMKMLARKDRFLKTVGFNKHYFHTGCTPLSFSLRDF